MRFLCPGRYLDVGPNASNAQIKNGTYTSEPVNGELTFGVIMMESSSKLRYTDHLKLDADLIHMRSQTLMSADTVLVSCSEALLEGGSIISTSARGPSSQSGLGAGKLTGNAGSGGGHGGQGGPSSTGDGGVAYGSYFNPVHPGSGGGGDSGGRGGSTIKVTHVTYSNKFLLNCYLFVY